MARSHSRGSEQTNDRLDNCSRLAYAPLSCRSDMGRLGQCIASRTAAGFHTLLHTLQKVSAVGQCFSPLGLTREVHITWITHEVFLCITLVHIWKKAKFCSEAQCSKILESDFFFFPGDCLLARMDSSFPTTKHASSETSCVRLIYRKGSHAILGNSQHQHSTRPFVDFPKSLASELKQPISRRQFGLCFIFRFCG